jgi:phospholipase/lecithinase/hemolysin
VATGGALPPSPLYFDGRFSNGKAWVEHFAKALRQPVSTPSILGGSIFAFNGARAAGASPYGTPDLTEQVSIYLFASGGTADPEDIFIVWAGANDFLFGASAGETDFTSNAIEAISTETFCLQNVTESATIFDPVTGIGYAPSPGVDPNRYLFWDSVHPTAQGHKIIAAYALIDYKLHCLRR